MRHLLTTVIFAFVLGLTLTSAQQSAGATVQAAEHETYGTYLTDADGRSLYLFTNDSENTSNCYDQCAENWPPLTVEGEPTAGEGVAGSLLGTITREDGSTQVTYSGWPLYYYVEDQAAGDIAGQGVGDVWYLVSPYGVAIEPEEEAPEEQASTEAAGAEEVPADLMSEGEEVYSSNCVVCHGENGEGGAGPALAGNDSLSDQEHVVRQILRGGAFMPPFGDQLSDRQVAAVSTYIMNAWDNSYGVVTEEEVSSAR